MVVPDSDEEKSVEVEKGIKKILSPVKDLPAAIVNASVRGLNVANKIANNKKIEEQEYTCFVLAFYMNGLKH